MLMLSEDGGGALGTTLSDYTAIGTKHPMEVERSDPVSWTEQLRYYGEATGYCEDYGSSRPDRLPCLLVYYHYHCNR